MPIIFVMTEGDDDPPSDNALKMMEELNTMHDRLTLFYKSLPDEESWADGWAESEDVPALREVAQMYGKIAFDPEFCNALVLPAIVMGTQGKIISALGAIWAAGFTDGWEMHKERLAAQKTSTRKSKQPEKED